ncbi:hypothetical protein CCMSSC00406_0008961 [Pleurotus cornucopiae]|uniref:Uncharacterized protein n=1 Tax=Pleurotus cornucopiae TaxID=5321 RepID=A0ACB7JB15_PLECO|nr:hypothetical protein CCMSSC00406_0008961 [Pleurotus cornucopiae]
MKIPTTSTTPAAVDALGDMMALVSISPARARLLGRALLAYADSFGPEDAEDTSVMSSSPADGSAASASTTSVPVSTAPAVANVTGTVPAPTTSAAVIPAPTTSAVVIPPLTTSAPALPVLTAPAVANATGTPPSVAPTPTVTSSAVTAGSATLVGASDDDDDSEPNIPPPGFVGAWPVSPMYDYAIPDYNEVGPYYVVVRGTEIGVFAGWDVVSPLVTGVPGAIHRRTATVALGIARMETALEHGSAAVIYM